MSDGGLGLLKEIVMQQVLPEVRDGARTASAMAAAAARMEASLDALRVRDDEIASRLDKIERIQEEAAEDRRALGKAMREIEASAHHAAQILGSAAPGGAPGGGWPSPSGGFTSLDSGGHAGIPMGPPGTRPTAEFNVVRDERPTPGAIDALRGAFASTLLDPVWGKVIVVAGALSLPVALVIAGLLLGAPVEKLIPGVGVPLADEDGGDP